MYFDSRAQDLKPAYSQGEWVIFFHMMRWPDTHMFLLSFIRYFYVFSCVVICFFLLTQNIPTEPQNFQVELDTVSGVYPNCPSAIFLVSVFSLFSEHGCLSGSPCSQHHSPYPLPTPNEFSNTKSWWCSSCSHPFIDGPLLKDIVTLCSHGFI